MCCQFTLFAPALKGAQTWFKVMVQGYFMWKYPDSTEKPNPSGAVWLCAGHPSALCHWRLILSAAHTKAVPALTQQFLNGALLLPECCLETPAAVGRDRCPGGFQPLHPSPWLGHPSGSHTQLGPWELPAPWPALPQGSYVLPQHQQLPSSFHFHLLSD